MDTSDISASKERRMKYTRDELFDVAESMNDTLIDRKQLNEFKKAELIYNLLEYNNHSLDKVNLRPPPKLQRSLSNHQNIERNLSANSQQLQQKIPQRISRMTSSPSLKYNRNHHQEERIMIRGDSGSISSQARAKYVELIENLKTSSSGGLEINTKSRRNQVVSRSNSLNFWQQSDEQMRPVPNTCFSRHETVDRRLDSDEPLSLPYILTNNNNNTGVDGKKSVAMKSSISGTLAEDLAHEPIRRLGSTSIAAAASALSHQKADNSNNEINDDDDDDDDDFDLNSMINITVLSDIKTIRQDFIHQQQSHQLSNNNRLKQQPTSIRHREHRTQETRPMLTRSRTATEFNYRGRSRQSDNNDQITTGAGVSPLTHNRMMNSSFDSTINQPTGYDSIPCTYSWQYSEQRHLGQRQSNQRSTRSMANPQISENGPIRVTSGPKDEKAAKIIETFKAQILARAASSSLPDKSMKSEEKQELIGREEVMVKKDFDLAKVESAEKKSIILTNDIITSNEQKLDVKGTESKQMESKQVESSEMTTTTTTKQVESSGQKKIPVVISNTSNIPRLISLQKKKDEVSIKSVVDLAKTTSTSVGMKTVASGAGSSTTSKPLSVSSTKIVSQYRKLRGKSLADELSEHQTSSK